MKNSKQTNRRNFIKKTTLATTGIISTTLPVRSFANVLDNKKLKLALVGCGGRGSGAVVNALSADDQVELVSMADVFQDKLDSSLKAITDHFDGRKKIKVKEKNKFIGFNSYKKAIDEADVVILTTPPGFRPYHFEYAINQNKHVFMEKPLATDPVGIRKVLEMAKIAKEKKLSVVVGLQRHYEKKYTTLHNMITQGNIGKITSGQVYWNDGGVWVNQRQVGQSELEYQMRNWYYFNWICGDHILEQHIHNIDVANWFIGSYPKSAQGMGGRQTRTGKEYGEIFDHHYVEFNYNSGAVISSQCRHQKGCDSRVDEVFQGTKGSVELGKGAITDLKGKELYRYPSVLGQEANPYQVEHDEFFKSIRSNDIISDAENGAKSTLSAIMGRMATYSGKTVTWDEALNSDHQIMPESVDWDTTPPSLPDENGFYSIPKPGVTKFST
tara:strand:+ start:192 stop:1514 length:1323 start_codon:yes stop_codon:yes gene_type:complete